MAHTPQTLSAPMQVSFDYTRSTGPVLGQFFAGLQQQQIIGGRLADGRVAVPPPEYDPETHQAVTEFVPVSDFGTVQTWTWVSEPVAEQPSTEPFAFAMILLDGADLPMLHAVSASDASAMSTGMRVRVRWADERHGAITDIASFEPAVEGDEAAAEQSRSTGLQLPDPITGIVVPVNLSYTYAASAEESAFYRGLAEGKVIGQRCPACGKVYVPPRSACPSDGVATTDEVELADIGTVTTFCVVNVPFMGQKITPPYVSAYILLDGADIAFLHLILDIPADEVRMGMRVKAVWKPESEWGTTIENISHFAPTDEPDADYDTYKHHL